MGPPEWTWHYTIVFDHDDEPKSINAPGRVFVATQEPTGCCADTPACRFPQLDPNTNVVHYVVDSKVTAKTSYSIDFKFSTFYTDGTFRRSTTENIRDFNPPTTDW